MRHATTTLCALAMFILAAGAAQADWIGLNNWSNGDNGNGTGPDWTLPGGPHATTDGALWIENTPGSPTLLAAEVNMQFKILTSAGWMSYTYLIGSTLDSATYPGYFSTLDTNSSFGVATGLTGSTQCEIFAWTGSYSTYTAAYNSHVAKVADSGVFANPLAYLAPGFGLTNMPAMDLKQAVPEPSTLLLTAAGLLGLLAYAWRKIARKRWAIVLVGTAILGLAAPNLWATGFYQFGGPDNFDNADGLYLQIPNDNPGTYYSTLPYGPTASEDGLVWLKTGSASPELYNNANLAVSIYYENSNSAWQLEETMISTQGYSGYFFGTADPTWGESRVVTNALVVSTETIPVIDLTGHPLTTFQQGLFYLQFWTDPALENTGTSAYSSYAQAFAASAAGASGVYVAQTVPFKVDFGGGGETPLLYANEMGMYMPAVVMAKAVATPEPSTAVLTLGGLLGLLAYAWRRRK